MRRLGLVWTELLHRRSQLVSGILAITLGIAVIVAIHSVTVVSEKAVAINLDNLGANILVLPQAANVDDYYAADIDAPTIPQEYVDRIVSSGSPRCRQSLAETGKACLRMARAPHRPDRHPPQPVRSPPSRSGSSPDCSPAPTCKPFSCDPDNAAEPGATATKTSASSTR